MMYTLIKKLVIIILQKHPLAKGRPIVYRRSPPCQLITAVRSFVSSTKAGSDIFCGVGTSARDDK